MSHAGILKAFSSISATPSGRSRRTAKDFGSHHWTRPRRCCDVSREPVPELVSPRRQRGELMTAYRVALLFLFWIAGVRSADAQMLTFPGICDASAAIAVDDRTIIVGDDEKPWLSVYDLRTLQLNTKLPLPFGGATAANSDPDDAPEADIEGATIFSGRIVWISSHGRNSKGKVKPDRFQLFASHTIDPRVGTATAGFSRSFRDLLPMVIGSTDAAYDPLHDAIGDLAKRNEALAPKRDGFNIEGLTVTKDGNALLIGMRNPLVDGRAILSELDGFDAFLNGDPSRLSVGKLMLVDLHDRGIRDIVWSPAHQSYLVAAGQADDNDQGPGFALFKWDGSAAPARISAFGDFNRDYDRFHLEAIVPLLQRSGDGFVSSNDVLVLSDDGARPMPDGKPCKTEPESLAHFRGLIRHVD